MFIRARPSARGGTYHQLVRSYRDAAGAVRQETLSVPSATVAESLAHVRSELRRLRRERTRYEPMRHRSWAQSAFDRADKAVRENEKRLAMLTEAERQGVP